MICFVAINNPMHSQEIFDDPLIINTEKGLPSNIVNVISQDSLGFIWIGTANGLAKYDGTTLVSFVHNPEDSTSLGGAYITAVIPDLKRDRIWVGHQQGLSYFDANKEQFYTYYHDAANPNSISDARVACMFLDSNEDLWIGMSQGGFVKYNYETNDFRHYGECKNIDSEAGESICQKGILSITEDLENDSLLYFGSTGVNTFNKYTGQYKHSYISFDDLKKNVVANIPKCMLSHSNGKIYYGTTNYGIFEYDPKKDKIKEIKPELADGVQTSEIIQVREILQKSDNELWITSTSGLSVYDIQNNIITSQYKNKEDQSYGVSYVDKEDRLWLASAWHGIHLFNPLLAQNEVLYFEDKEEPFPSFAIRVLVDTFMNRYVVCAFSSNGLYIYDIKSKKWTTIPPPSSYNLKGKGGFQSWDICMLDDGTVLVLEDEKLYYYRYGFKELKPYPLQFEDKYPGYRSITRRNNGTYWIVSQFEPFLSELNIKENTLKSFQNEISALNNEKLSIFGIIEDVEENVWMLELNGLIVFEQATNEFLYHSYRDPKLKSNQTIGRHIGADQYGRVWISSKNPYLSYTTMDEIKQNKINTFGKDDGLIANATICTRSIDNKHIIFSDMGVQVFDLDSWKFKVRYDKEYRFTQPIVNNTLLKNYGIVVGNMKRIAILPNNVDLNTEIPTPYFTSFKIFDEEVPLFQDKRQKDTDGNWKCNLSYKENFFSFEYSSIGFNLPEKIKYEYKLEGFDEKWYDGTERKYSSYTNVPGGDYIFKLRVYNNEGMSGPPAEIYLTVSTVWWKTKLFWAAAIAFFGLFGYTFYSWRIGEIRKEERLKSEYESRLSEMEMSALRAQMNPHFIFNALNSIDYYIISNDQEKASDYLNRFSRLIRLILQNSKSTVVPLQDDLEALKLYIEIESMRFDEMFEYEFLLEDKIEADKIDIPPMILQPYVENSIWHGLKQKNEGKGKLTIKVRRGEGAIICTIEDNGIGREAAEVLKSKSGAKRKSYGMKITKGRLEALNQLANTKASVQIFDLFDDENKSRGTRVEIVIPI